MRHCGVSTARQTIERTAQLAVRDFTNKQRTKRLKHIYHQLKYTRFTCVLYTDTLFGPSPSSQLNTCGELYATDFEWSWVYPMMAERETHNTLGLFHHQHGVPTILMQDNAMALTAGKLRRKEVL